MQAPCRSFIHDHPFHPRLHHGGTSSLPSISIAPSNSATASLRSTTAFLLNKSIAISPVFGNTYCKHVCRASGKSNNNQDNSSDEEIDDFYSIQDPKPTVGNTNKSEPPNQTSSIEDWRSFRARLVASESTEGVSTEQYNVPLLANKWAHPILAPETGCLLVATEKLDGQSPFERSVILLLRLGSIQPQDGPFGVILNRPILNTISESEPITQKMAQILRNSLLFYGGPLATHIFLVKKEGSGDQFNGLEKIMNGIYYGFSDGSQLQHVEKFAKAGDDKGHFRNYFGYAGWDFHQLENEINEKFWYVAACSPELIMETPSESLWQEILMAMGGEYAEVSKRTRMDGI